MEEVANLSNYGETMLWKPQLGLEKYVCTMLMPAIVLAEQESACTNSKDELEDHEICHCIVSQHSSASLYVIEYRR